MGHAHHGLSDLLLGSLESESAFDELERFLDANTERSVLLSAEGLTNWLQSNEKLETLLSFFAAVRGVTATRCIWTLRRYDEALISEYLAQLAFGLRIRPLTERVGDIPDPDMQFAGMCRVEEAVGNEVTYVKYGSTGGHNISLLRCFEMPDELIDEICQTLERSPRLNVGVTQKQAVALLNPEALSARSGVEFDGSAVRAAWRRGDLDFEQDRRCALLAADSRRALHDRALAAAQRQGFDLYAEFFGNEKIFGPASVSLVPAELTDADLQQLVASCVPSSPEARLT
ncbi:MAG TPA: hypothetical protein VF085_09940 [Solirubrobacterales bacterium]